MAAEDDTFDIDIYGDEGQDFQQEDGDEQWLDGTNDSQQDPINAQTDDAVKPETSEPQAEQAQGESNASPAPQSSLKRKAPDDDTPTTAQAPSKQSNSAESYVDDRPLDPGAMPALRLTELFWWTTEEDVRGFAARAGAEDELQDVAFGEHKINGKSRGEAYMEFLSAQAATATKREVDKGMNAEAGSKAKIPFTVQFTPLGNPFKAFQKDGGGTGGLGPKKDFGSKFNNQQGGAYNQNFAGGRGGRGNFHNNRGGFNNNRGGYNSNNNGSNNMHNGGGGGWGMPGNFGGNPMMAGFNNNMGGGFGMGRGNMNMMGNMMGRGGFGRGGYGGGMGGMNGMNPMNMGMMGNMMGMNFNQGGGMQQGGYGGGGGNNYGDGNKRMRTE